jgi:hypothetical protein
LRCSGPGPRPWQPVHRQLLRLCCHRGIRKGRGQLSFRVQQLGRLLARHKSCRTNSNGH